MTVTPLEVRERYEPSGGIDWRFAPLAAGTFIAALALGGLLYLLFQAGVYLLLLIPAFMAIPLSFLVYGAVRAGHCRSRLIGSALGLAAGVVLYLGSYYTGMVHSIGLGGWHRIDLLPRYIEWRAQNDVARGNHGPADEKPKPGLNLFFMILELSTVVFMTAFAGRASAGRTYCEDCRSWKRRKAIFLPPGSSAPFARALDSGDFSGLEGLQEIEMRVDTRQYAATILERCPSPGHAGGTCPTFLTVREIRFGGGAGTIPRLDLSIGRSPIDRVAIAPEEVSRLGRLFPALAGPSRQEAAVPAPVEVA